MELLKRINLISKLTLLTALIMFIYGIICRIIPIYFFWESLYLSAIVFLIGVFFVLNFESKKIQSESKSNIVLIIGKAFTILSIIMFVLINILFNNSDALKTIENHVKNNTELTNELGQINSVIALPIGSINSKMDSRGKSGNATLTLLLKGDKKYKEMMFSAQKDFDSDWKTIEKN
ncbi:cytochrome c oxidase assembly factor Coa1 family protein [Thalassobellus sediminis]|uniref:cytochrome c oxidase assembly factor Coa1 family protein n=1 Tax=Thalassobellus sediminis TaxID=3367753 RepID=UPI00378925A2